MVNLIHKQKIMMDPNTNPVNPTDETQAQSEASEMSNVEEMPASSAEETPTEAMQ